MMGWLALLLAAVVVAAFLFVLGTWGRRPPVDGQWPFEARRPLSQVEQVLYFRLRNALPGHIILAQVQLSRLLAVKHGNEHHAWNNRINRMSADFVVCERDARVVAVIELDDASHQRAQRRDVDARKDKALCSAGIRVVRWQAKSLPDDAAIKAAMELGERPVAVSD